MLLTKSDKLSRNEAAATLASVRRELAALGPQISVQLFSSLKKIGMEEVEHKVAEWLNLPTEDLPAIPTAAERRAAAK